MNTEITMQLSCGHGNQVNGLWSDLDEKNLRRALLLENSDLITMYDTRITQRNTSHYYKLQVALIIGLHARGRLVVAAMLK